MMRRIAIGLTVALTVVGTSLHVSAQETGMGSMGGGGTMPMMPMMGQGGGMMPMMMGQMPMMQGGMVPMMPCGPAGMGGSMPMMMGQGGGMMPMMMGKMPMMPMMQGGPMPMMMGMGHGGGMIDADRDGVVSAEELADHADLAFDMKDADGDEVLSKDEFLGQHGAMMGTRRAERRMARFGAMDANGDGALGYAEFMDGHRAMLTAADIDGDGRVTIWEFRIAKRG